MATFTGDEFGPSADIASAKGAGELTGFTGGTIPELQDTIGDTFFGLELNDTVEAGNGNDTINGGPGDDSLNGQGGNDLINGQSNDDWLKGAAGDDTLDGGAGQDTLLGGENNDLLIGGPGPDSLNGGPQIDTVSYATSTDPVMVDLESGGSGGDAEGDSYANIENIIGSPGDDTSLKGTGASNTIDGGDGDDNLQGRAGDDELTGGGPSTLFGDPELGVSSFGSDAGWSSQNLFPRALGDVDGANGDDIVGFGDGFTWVSLSKGDGTFEDPEIAVDSFTPAQGWISHDQFPRTVGDVDNDGNEDIVGFGDGFTWVSLSKGDGTFEDPEIGLDSFTPAQGWTSQNEFPRMLGDVDGANGDDIVGFGDGFTWVSLSKGDGTFEDPEIGLDSFTPAQGWTSQNDFPRMLGDVDNDGSEDIVGFGDGFTWVSLSKGDGTFEDPEIASANFTPAQGWTSQDLFPRSLEDVDGDGDADIIGHGDGFTWVGLSKGDGTFADPIIATEQFTPTQGWTSQDVFPRLAGDVTGDGKADIVGFTNVTLVSESTADTDLFFFQDGFGDDTITDFRVGSDTIWLDSIPGIDDFGDLDIANGPPAEVGVNADSITLTGVSGTQLSEADFIIT